MININYLSQKGLEPYDHFLLQLLAQNSSEDMSEWLIMYLTEPHLKRLLSMGLIETLKKKKRKDDHDFTILRLSSKGRQIWRDSKVPNYTEQDELLVEYLVSQYGKVEKPVGNQEKVKELLAWFRNETGFTRKQVYKAVSFFLKAAQEDSGGKYIPSLENLIWKGGTVFQKVPKLSESKLYQFIIENKDLLNADKTGKESG
jgi:hypothetical protein